MTIEEPHHTTTQKRFGTSLITVYGAESMKCTIRDHSGQRDFSVPYETINVLAPATLTVYNQYIFRILFLLPLGILVLSSIPIVVRTGFVQDLQFLAALVFGILLVARHFRLLATHYTTLEMAPRPAGAAHHPIRIIKDKQHDAILADIKERWKGRLKFLHATPNLANNPGHEIKKFEWLLQQGIITDEEFHQAIARITVGMAGLHDEGSPRGLH